MSIPDEKVGMEKAPSPGLQSRDSLSSTRDSRNIDSKSDETTSPIKEQAVSQPTDDNVEAANPQAPAPDSAAEAYNLKSPKFWLIVVSCFGSMFLVALDRTIISTAIPTITNEFHSLADIGWYGSAYMLTTAAFQLIWGRIYRFYDMRWTFLCSIIIFEIGSAVCGSAPRSSVFIGGRAIAGLGSAGITTGSLLTIVDMVPLAKRPMFQAAFGLVFGVSSVTGPLMGGALAQNVSWRWCFYINLPVGAAAFVFLLIFLRLPKKVHPPATVKQHILRLDPFGTFFFIPSIVCLLLALQWGGSEYTWNNWRIIFLFVMFGVTAVVFAIIQIKMPETASIPPKVIMQRTMLSATAFMFLGTGSMMLLVYYIPTWFQTTHGVSPVRSGIYTIPLVLSLVVAVTMSGFLTQRIGYYVPALVIGPCIMSIGEGLLYTLKPSSGSNEWIAYQFLAGFGLGFGFQTSNLAVQATVPKKEIPTGVTILFFAQQLGGAIFVTVGQTILNSLLNSHLKGVPGLDPSIIANSGVTELRNLVPPQYVSVVVNAYNYACTHIFLAAMVLTLVQILTACSFEWGSIKKPKNEQEKPQ